MKYCTDCKYCHNKFSVMSVCLNTKFLDKNMVTKTKLYKPCYSMRLDENLCGEEAKLFEPSLLYKIKKVFK